MCTLTTLLIVFRPFQQQQHAHTNRFATHWSDEDWGLGHQLKAVTDRTAWQTLSAFLAPNSVEKELPLLLCFSKSRFMASQDRLATVTLDLHRPDIMPGQLASLKPQASLFNLSKKRQCSMSRGLLSPWEAAGCTPLPLPYTSTKWSTYPLAKAVPLGLQFFTNSS